MLVMLKQAFLTFINLKILFTGAIFTPGSEEMQTAFNYAIAAHNSNDTQARFKVETVLEVLDSDDSYKIGQTCKIFLNVSVINSVYIYSI